MQKSLDSISLTFLPHVKISCLELNESRIYSISFPLNSQCYSFLTPIAQAISNNHCLCCLQDILPPMHDNEFKTNLPKRIIALLDYKSMSFIDSFRYLDASITPTLFFKMDTQFFTPMPMHKVK